MFLVRHLHFARAYQAAILACKANRLPAIVVDQHDDVLLNFAAQHPFDDFHRLFVGNAHALHEAALLTDFFQCVVDLRSTAMNHNGIHTDQLEQNDIARKAMLETLFRHRVTAVFDDNGLAVEFANVRQSLGQYLGLDFGSNRRGGHGAGNSGEGVRSGRPRSGEATCADEKLARFYRQNHRYSRAPDCLFQPRTIASDTTGRNSDECMHTMRPDIHLRHGGQPRERPLLVHGFTTAATRTT